MGERPVQEEERGIGLGQARRSDRTSPFHGRGKGEGKDWVD